MARQWIKYILNIDTMFCLRKFLCFQTISDSLELLFMKVRKHTIIDIDGHETKWD